MKNQLINQNSSAHVKSFSLIQLFTVLTVLLFVLSACASATPVPTEAAVTEAAATEASTTEPTAEPTKELITVKIGVSPAPHGDIIKFIQENLAEEAGLNIEIVEFTDYVQPNLALAEGEIDANYFQHLPYLEDFNTEHGLELVSVAAIHIEPLGIYSTKITSLDEITDGAVVAIPNDVTNAGRALSLLADNGLITLKEGVGVSATVADITANPKNLDITELEAAQLVRSLEDATIAVINGNYAIEGGLSPATDALALESGEDNPYANILVVNKGHENDEGIQILISLLTSPEVKTFIEEKYNGSVIPAF